MDMATTVVRIMLFFPNLYSNLVVSSAWHIFLLSAQQPPNNPKKPATTAIFEGNEGLKQLTPPYIFSKIAMFSQKCLALLRSHPPTTIVV